MIRRIGRPGLIGTMARTAVIAGTATAVAGGVQAHQQAKAQQQQAATWPPMPADSVEGQLAQLAQLNQSGLIDDAEYAAAKAKLLGI